MACIGGLLTTGETVKLSERNKVIRELAARGNKVQSLTAAQWAEAIRILGDQIREELLATNERKSLTLDLLNTSVSRKRR